MFLQFFLFIKLTICIVVKKKQKMNKDQIISFTKEVLVVVVGVLLANVATQQLAKIKISKPLEVTEE